MFFRFVKSKWIDGMVRIGLPALGSSDKVYIEAKGITAISALFLNQKEKAQLAKLAISDVNNPEL